MPTIMLNSESDSRYIVHSSDRYSCDYLEHNKPSLMQPSYQFTKTQTVICCILTIENIVHHMTDYVTTHITSAVSLPSSYIAFFLDFNWQILQQYFQSQCCWSSLLQWSRETNHTACLGQQLNAADCSLSFFLLCLARGPYNREALGHGLVGLCVNPALLADGPRIYEWCRLSSHWRPHHSNFGTYRALIQSGNSAKQ